MSLSKKTAKSVVSLMLAFSMLAPMNFNSLTTIAAEPSAITANQIDETFLPTRTDIPNYLSKYSSYKGEMIKKIWAKLFFEELNWNTDVSKNPDFYFYDSNYSAWYQKYNHGYNKAGDVVPYTYTSIGGEAKQLNEQITFSTGDFETFFGNTIEANPDFMGQMMGLSSYEKLGTSDVGNETMKKVITTYLNNPEKYPNFAQSIAALTKDGLYIGTSKTSNDNILKNASYNGQTYDIYVLIALASLYKGDGTEPYLSTIQVNWLKSYQRYLYDNYCDAGTSSLASRFKSIYDLIARSADASNNYRDKGQEFFNYVVNSKTGGGAWINQINGVNISGLDAVQDIANIYTFAEGYCYGHESNCANHTYCLPRENGGKAIKHDEFAYYIYKTAPLAITYIKNNSVLNPLYTNPSSPDGGWLEKYTWRHTPGGGTPIYTTSGAIVTDGYAQGLHDNKYTECGQITAYSNATSVATLNLIDIDKKISGEPLSRTQTISVTWTAGSVNGWGYITSHGIDYSVYINGSNVGKSRVPVTMNSTSDYAGTLTFDITGLTWAERQNCTIYITNSVAVEQSYNGLEYNSSHTGYNCHDGYANAWAQVNTLSNVTLTVKRSDCFIEGHDWKGRITWNSNHSAADITYICQNDVKHEATLHLSESDITKTIDGNQIVYTASAAPYIWNSEKNDYDSYSARVNRSNGSSTETIALDSSNSTGIRSNSAQSSEVVWPEGSWSKEVYTNATSYIAFTVNSGVIKTGAKYVRPNITANNSLTGLSIQVFNKRGQLLAYNNPLMDSTGCDLSSFTDSQLEGCYMVVSATSQTRNYAAAGWTPATAYTSIWVSGITVTYN